MHTEDGYHRSVSLHPPLLQNSMRTAIVSPVCYTRYCCYSSSQCFMLQPAGGPSSSIRSLFIFKASVDTSIQEARQYHVSDSHSGIADKGFKYETRMCPSVAPMDELVIEGQPTHHLRQQAYKTLRFVISNMLWLSASLTQLTLVQIVKSLECFACSKSVIRVLGI